MSNAEVNEAFFQEEKAEAFAEARAEAVAEERASIVKWLREREKRVVLDCCCYAYAADEIEAGNHKEKME